MYRDVNKQVQAWKNLTWSMYFPQTWCDEAINHVTMSKSAFYPSARTCSEQLKALRIFERVML